MQRSLKSMTTGSIMIIISLIFISQSLMMEKADITNPADGNFFPMLISVIMLICGITVLFQKNADETEGETLSLKKYRFILLYFLLIVIYVILLSIISFFPATFVFLFTSMIYLRNVSLI